MTSPAISPNVDIKIDGTAVPDDHIQSFVIDRDMFQPDMAVLVLANQNDVYSVTKVASAIEVSIGEGATSIFKGEVVGIEPSYKGGSKSVIVIRAMNKLHRLIRGRKSKTYLNASDKDIAGQVLGNHGLTLEWTGPTITHKHVYQHNQTDLEFLRTRAARVGCHVWCVDTKVFCKKPNLGNSSGKKLSVDENPAAGEVQLRSFMPRISSAAIVKKVSVKGWDPEKKELIVGTAQMQNSPLGSKHASSASGPHGSEETFTVDHPIWSAEEATAIAEARIMDSGLSYMTGEAECTGSTETAELELGSTVEIKANAAGQDPFNGKYYLMGITHRQTPKGKDGGLVSILKLARDAEGG